MLRRYKALPVLVAALLLLLAFSYAVRWWLMQETWALEGYALFDWVHDLGRFYLRSVEGTQREYFVLSWLFPILFSALILTVANTALVIFVILFRRWISIKHWDTKSRMHEKVQKALVEYLYGDAEIACGQMERLNRQVLLLEIVGLRQQIIGTKAERLQHLFYDLHLDRFILHQIPTAPWYDKMMYIDAAQWMLVYEAAERIKPYQHAGNPYLRNAAQVAGVTLDTGHSFAFLNILEYSLPVWHQITLHKAMVRNSLPLPDFYAFLSSGNASVVVFALNMIRLFAQKGPEEEIVRLVAHPDPVVRRNALRVVRDLKIYQAIPVVKQNFLNETLRVQVGMIHALSLDKPLETLDFYKNIWIETPRRVQAEILKHASPGLKAMLVKEIEQTQK